MAIIRPISRMPYSVHFMCALGSQLGQGSLSDKPVREPPSAEKGHLYVRKGLLSRLELLRPRTEAIDVAADRARGSG
jgi:hypothetical protein